MSTLISSKSMLWIAVISLTVLLLSSCHRDGCPNKITQVNPVGVEAVS